jgi:hypothetical protein
MAVSILDCVSSIISKLMNKFERIWKETIMAELMYCHNIWLVGLRETWETSLSVICVLAKI